MKIDPGLKEDLKRYLKEKIKKESEKIKVVSAYKLSDQELTQVLKKFPELRGKDVITQVDSNLLAGVIIKYKSKVIDLSLKGRFEDLTSTVYELD